MAKSTPKKKIDNLKSAVVKRVAEKYLVTGKYVYAIIAEDSIITGGQSEDIRREYRELYAELERVLA